MIIEFLLMEALRILFRKVLPFLVKMLLESKMWYLLIPWARVVLRARNSPERDAAEFGLGWEEAGWDSI